MDYMNQASVQANIASYQEALKKMLEYCTDFEPIGQESRNVLPLEFRPVGIFDREKIRRDANYITAYHGKLMDFGKPLYIAKGYWVYDTFFKVSWQLLIRFDFYGWKRGQITCPEGYEDDGTPKGETVHIPPVMEAQNPKCISLGELSNYGMKTWSLPDWWTHHDEIESFMDDNLTLKDKYRKSVEDADKEVNAWQSALKDFSKLSDIFEPKEVKQEVSQ